MIERSTTMPEGLKAAFIDRIEHAGSVEALRALIVELERLPGASELVELCASHIDLLDRFFEVIERRSN